MATCGYALIARRLPGADAESMTRLIQGLAAGIGFIGGGVILRHGERVEGLATAASIWTTGAIGIAVAFDRFEIALVLSLGNFLCLLLLGPHRPIASKSTKAPEASTDFDGGDLHTLHRAAKKETDRPS